MKQILIKPAILVVLWLSAFSVYSQTNVFSFGYDNSGNRSDRTFIQLKSGNAASNNSFENDIFIDHLNNQEIIIYPNPTKGELKVDIKNADPNDNLVIQVYTLKGSKLMEKNVTGDMTVINLFGQPTGIYILRISNGTNSLDWKVLKE